MPDFQYMPITGPLPGSSFEKQTVEFFKQIQQQLDVLVNRLDVFERTSGADLTELQQQLVELQTGLQSTNEAVQTAQTTAEQAGLDAATAQTAADNAGATATTAQQSATNALATAQEALEAAQQAESSTVPNGAIVLMQDGTTLPQSGWVIADGTGDTPDLSGFGDGIVFVLHTASAEE